MKPVQILNKHLGLFLKIAAIAAVLVLIYKTMNQMKRYLLCQVLLSLCFAVIFTACGSGETATTGDNSQNRETGAKSNNNTNNSTQDGKFAKYLNKVTGKNKEGLKDILQLLDSKNLDICEVDKELLQISTNARKEAETKFGAVSNESFDYRRKTEEQRKKGYWKEKGLPDSLSGYVAIYTMKLDCK